MRAFNSDHKILKSILKLKLFCNVATYVKLTRDCQKFYFKAQMEILLLNQVQLYLNDILQQMVPRQGWS